MGKIRFLICISHACVGVAYAHQDLTPPTEYQVKAAFLLNFARFVEWPPEAFANDSTAITIGILGKDPFGADLDRLLERETVEGRRFAIRRVRHQQEIKGCHILFISSAEAKDHLRRILRELAGASVLTVGETERFARDGGMIRFLLREKRVRFEINVVAARHARLQISSNLLKLARTVIGEGGGRE